MNRELKGKIATIFVLTAISCVFSIALFLSGILSLFEFKAFDLFSKNLNPETPPGDIVYIQIDQQTIDALSRQSFINWPWPRQVYGPLIEYMAGADAIFLDLLFTEASSYGRQDDILMAEALRKASNVHLPLFLTDNRKNMDTEDNEFLKKYSLPGNLTTALSFNYAITPISPQKDSVAGSGNVGIPPDSDGVYRKIPLVFKTGEYTIPQFVLSYLIRKGKVTVRDGQLYSGDIKVPLLEGKWLTLRYYRKDKPFKTYSALQILDAYNQAASGKKPEITKDFFKGKKIFIGLTAPGLYDLRPTSISSISTGVLIHATTYDNLANRNFIRPVDKAYVILFMVLIILVISYAVLRYYSFTISLPVFLLALIVALAVPAALFRSGCYMHIIPPTLSLITGFIIAVAYSYATEGKERRFVRKTFSQYMDETIVDYVLKNPSLMKPGGQRRYITAFFTDIAGFTSMAERMPSEEVSRMLHAVLNDFTEVIIQHHGVIDKYIGDAIMAFWGAPLDTKRDEVNACRAALDCIKTLNALNESFRKEGLSEISVRIGIHSGNAIAGNLGSDRIFDFTVIGDTVNLTSRLEAVNKVFSTKIIVSEETLKKTGDLFVARELGLIEVKGKNIPVRIFELIGEKDIVDDPVRITACLFNRGLELYYEGRLPDALRTFNEVLQENPGDGPAAFYQKRCSLFIEHSPTGDDWKIIKLTEK